MGYLDVTIFFLCNDPERALGLEMLLPNLHIICIDDNPIIDYMLERGVKVFCLERELGENNVIFRNSNKLLHQASVQEYIRKNTPENEIPKVMFFKIASNIEKTCEKLNYQILNTTSELNKKFETKISQFNILKNEAVNFPKTLVGSLENFEYSNLVEELGEKFVIQYARGHTGLSTVFVDCEETFLRERNSYPLRIARIARYIKGEAWTINACATRFGILFGGLSFQITGVSDLTSREGGTVGNDWYQDSNLSSFSKEQIEKITVRVGRVMKRFGFLGLFGLDLIVDEKGEVFLIEVNARQPASTGMHSKLMLEQGLIPLQVFHIAEFLGGDDEYYYGFLTAFYRKINKEKKTDNDINFDLKNEMVRSKFRNSQNAKAINQINAAQVFIRNTKSEKVIINDSLIPGIYEGTESLKFIRNGYSISDVQKESEYLLLAQAKGLAVSSGSEVARVQMRHSAVAKETFLNKDLLELLIGIKNKLM